MKKTVILLGILTLLVLLTLNRWDIRLYSDGTVQVRVDKLTGQTQYVTMRKGEYITWIENKKYLIYSTTAFLYSAIATTTIALLLEARKKE